MQIQINFGDVPTSEPIQERVEKEVGEALAKWQDRVTRVEVHLHDEDGPKQSNTDKRCVMEVRLSGRQPMVVEHSCDDMYTSIHTAATKLEKVVGRAIERQRDH